MDEEDWATRVNEISWTLKLIKKILWGTPQKK